MAVCIGICTSVSDIQAYIKIDRSEQYSNYSLPAWTWAYVIFQAFTLLLAFRFALET